MAYLVESWNPWDCSIIHKKIFINKSCLYNYLAEYVLDKEKEEELTIHEIEIGD